MLFNLTREFIPVQPCMNLNAYVSRFQSRVKRLRNSPSVKRTAWCSGYHQMAAAIFNLGRFLDKSSNQLSNSQRSKTKRKRKTFFIKSKLDEHQKPTMKIFSAFFAFAQAIDSSLLAIMMMQQQQVAPGQTNQMNMLLPLVLLDDDNSASNDNSLVLMMMAMQGGNMGDANAILPFLLLDDDDNNSTDFLSLFVYSTMLQNDCNVATDNVFGNLLPLLLLDGDSAFSSGSSNKNLMMMLMMQTMGNSPMSMDSILPMMLLLDDDSNSNDSILMMVLLNSMTGGLNTPMGFENNFNMLLPLVLLSDDSDDALDTDLLMVMFALQTQAPNTAFSTNMMLPLLLMSDDSDDNNESLIFFMMMNQNKQRCEPVYVYEPAPAAPVIVRQPQTVETVFRTWQVNPQTGERTLVNEETGNQVVYSD